MRPETTVMAIIPRPRAIEFVERAIPPLSGDEVLVRVEACAVCGSDLHLYHDRHPFVSLPSAAGHEVAGTVVETGESAHHLQAGDSVVVEPVIPCGRCAACLRGRYHLCEAITFHYRQGQGGFAGYFVARERWLHPVPEGVDLDLAALAEPLAVALHAIEKAGLRAGDSACIYGDGPIGLLLTAALARILAVRIILVGHREERLALGLELGADRAVDGRAVDAAEIRDRILKETGGQGVSAVFEAAGKETALREALPLLKKGGTLVMVGLYQDSPVPLDANLVIARELSVKGSQGYCWNFPGALRLLKEASATLGRLITHTFPLRALREAFECLSSPDGRAVKIVIHPHDA